MNENNNMNSFDNQREVFKPESEKGNGSLLWIIVGVIVLGLAAWFIWGSSNSNIVDDLDSTRVLEVSGELSEDVTYDDRGMPILGPNAPISAADVIVSEGFPVQVTLRVSGELINGCTYLNQPVILREGKDFYVSLTTYTEGEVCTEALVPYERNITLNVTSLPAGTYNVDINGMVKSFEIEQENSLDFETASDK